MRPSPAPSGGRQSLRRPQCAPLAPARRPGPRPTRWPPSGAPPPSLPPPRAAQSPPGGPAADLLASALSSLDLLQRAPPGSDPGSDADAAANAAADAAEKAQPAAGRAVYEVLRVDGSGVGRRIYVKRRDLLRANGLQPRDLRRIDPSLSLTKTAPSVTVKGASLLINVGGVRAIVRANKCLLFEPASTSSQRWLDILQPRLAERVGDGDGVDGGSGVDDPFRRRAALATLSSDGALDDDDGARAPPFELEALEAALMVATGRLDAELLAVTDRVTRVLQALPSEVTPVNLEELRRVKQALVELESRADTLREVLEEVLDDDDEVREMNLTSRPAREEKRRTRERERLERDIEERERERARAAAAAADEGDGERERGASPLGLADPASAAAADAGPATPRRDENGRPLPSEWTKARRGGSGDDSRDDAPAAAAAEEALEELEEDEAEEREIEEIEDLLEYYLARAATTQSEAERLLAGARDLEESIAVSLSARRFELSRLELTLSIGSFAAALGAVFAGIFGMNLRSTLEHSVAGFWGTTVAILLACVWVFLALYTYTRRRRIL